MDHNTIFKKLIDTILKKAEIKHDKYDVTPLTKQASKITLRQTRLIIASIYYYADRNLLQIYSSLEEHERYNLEDPLLTTKVATFLKEAAKHPDHAPDL